MDEPAAEEGDVGALRNGGWRRICGIDEAGRGPLAGPVVAAAVILPHRIAADDIVDSKSLEPGRRRELANLLFRRAIVSVASASASTIDRLNIRRASLWAMRRALAGLPVRPDIVLFDGRDVPLGAECLGFAVTGGDRLSQSVAAASIVAKVTRDALMTRLGERMPDYGFERHKGYGTADHKDALMRLGPSIHHRLTFRPVREARGTAVQPV